MAGAILDRQLSGPAPTSSTRVQFTPARVEDDAALRQLLRTTAMQGSIRLTFEREPSYFRGCGVAGATDQTIVASEDGRLVCMGRSSVQDRFLNGSARRVGYLGELRLETSARGRFDILRRGYRYFRQLQEEDPPDVWFTSIAADNRRSIRFLERGLPGMPRYDFLGGFVSLLMAVPRRFAAARRLESRAQRRVDAAGLRWEAGTPGLVERMSALLADHGSRFQFATAWTGARIESLKDWGLPLSDWLCLLRGRQIVACTALWDQRSFRQIVLRGFSRPVAISRPFVNLAAWACGVAGIPSLGCSLAQGFLSPFAVAVGEEGLLVPLIEMSMAQARQRGLEFLTLGLPAADPRLPGLRSRFPCRAYHSRLCRVSWAEEGMDVALDGRPALPEVALL